MMGAAGLRKLDYEKLNTQIIKPKLDVLKERTEQHNEKDEEYQLYNKDLREKIKDVQTALSTISDPKQFFQYEVSTDDPNNKTVVASITDSEKAYIGEFDVVVQQLAAPHKIETSSFSSSTQPFNNSSMLGSSFTGGSFILNGKTVQVMATDTLESLRNKIRATGIANSSVLEEDDGLALSIESSKSGLINALQLVELSPGNVLTQLGILQASGMGWRSQVPIANTTQIQATSLGGNDPAQPLQKALELGTSYIGNVTLFGGQISIDLSTDTLNSLVTKINGLNTPPLSAKVICDHLSAKENKVYRLQITGDNTQTTTDSGQVLEVLGLRQRTIQNSYKNPQDAIYQIDGRSKKSSDNNVMNARAGVSIQLKKVSPPDVLNPGQYIASQVTISNAPEKAVEHVKEFIEKLNELREFINENSQVSYKKDALGKENGKFGVFSSDVVISNLKQNINQLVINKEMMSLGIRFEGASQNMKIEFDAEKFKKVLSDNPSQIYQKLFLNRSPDDGLFKYYPNYDQTVEAKIPSSPLEGYPVQINQPATNTMATAVVANTTANTQPEILTFSGNAFGKNKSYMLNINVNDTLINTVANINAFPIVKDKLIASIDTGSGKLKIESKNPGSGYNFMVVSNLNAANDNSGIGIADENAGCLILGSNVSGTINGQECSGSGRILTVKDKDSNGKYQTLQGLMLGYQGTTSGHVGNFIYVKGELQKFVDTVQSLTKPGGALYNELQIKAAKLGEEKEMIEADVEKLREDDRKLKQTITEKNSMIEDAQMQAALMKQGRYF